MLLTTSWLLAGLLFTPHNGPPVTFAGLLPKLVENGQHSQQALPSLSGEETFHSVRLGSEIFWLPLHADTRMRGDQRRMAVEYSGCHRFTSSVTITGGTATVSEPHR